MKALAARSASARRAVAALTVLIAAVALLACGKSDHLPTQTQAGAAKHDHAGAQAKGKSNAEPKTTAQASALARALNLRHGDLPGFTAAAPSGGSSAGEQALARKLHACIGASAPAPLAEASSATYQDHGHLLDLSISSSVKILKDRAQAGAELKLLRSKRTSGCLRQFVATLLALEIKHGAQAKVVSIDSGTPSAPGTSGGFGWRILGNFSADGIRIPFYIDLLGFDYEQASVSLFSIGLPTPLPANAERELFTLLVDRAKAGGKATPGPPPAEAPHSSGPRQLQISL